MITCWTYGTETSAHIVANLLLRARVLEPDGRPTEDFAAFDAIRCIMSWIYEKEREDWNGIVIHSEWRR